VISFLNRHPGLDPGSMPQSRLKTSLTINLVRANMPGTWAAWTLKQVQGDTIRLARFFLTGSLLTLAACNQSPYAKMSTEETAEMADIARVNGANALAKIIELESRIDELERENREQAQLISDLEDNLRR
jgi:hypothetical protein